MIVPNFWSEAGLQERVNGRTVTVRRYGWSDLSPEDARIHATARAREALNRIARGESLKRRDPKTAYGGADGIPIREEIVSRHGETIITRNAYGARCLNTPNVLFADIDFPTGPGVTLSVSVLAILCACAAILGITLQSTWITLTGFLGAIASFYPLAQWIFQIPLGGPARSQVAVLKRIHRFLAQHPDWHLRTYQTPAGLRVLVLHQVFASDDPEVAHFFKALGTDPIYARMCRYQKCFRARVSPKPWRIGIEKHLRPRPGVWPIRSERLPAREAWVAAYESAATGFAACRFLDDLGHPQVHPAAKAVQVLHDELCRTASSLPIA